MPSLSRYAPWLYALLSMLAFAANSLLNREALAMVHIDPLSFAAIRTVSGALMLTLLVMCSTGRQSQKKSVRAAGGSWLGAISLTVYMFAFSIAYISLDAGLGALLLFSAVQFCMISWALLHKERFSVLQWVMLLVAMTAFFILLSPQGTDVHLGYSGIMIVAGVAWGSYSILGQGRKDATLASADNFQRAAMLSVLIMVGVLVSQQTLFAHPKGLVLAFVSGAITSALGYALWYRVIQRIKASQAAVMQLSVPPLAMVGGAVLLGERIDGTAMISAAVLVAAIGVFIIARQKQGQH
ncbi:DMT family transporter [Pseudoalteromonas sp. CNC9-20]|uniref:DMT family transporter n=1 Tax=Pseudoalteromonas sp. CNC9-20 TaxID=2917750 RepID=UPI001EF49191|nr:DMT family transporter [Pseudoalteromonas sp. CNC9-20]MCG7568971.1 DMT family transporter [Pseudoalteromonas sp. CNC9-20]